MSNESECQNDLYPPEDAVNSAHLNWLTFALFRVWDYTYQQPGSRTAYRECSVTCWVGSTLRFGMSPQFLPDIEARPRHIHRKIWGNSSIIRDGDRTGAGGDWHKEQVSKQKLPVSITTPERDIYIQLGSSIKKEIEPWRPASICQSHSVFCSSVFLPMKPLIPDFFLFTHFPELPTLCPQGSDESFLCHSHLYKATTSSSFSRRSIF